LPDKKRLIVITGPTASGKTAITINLAEHFKTEILSADSRQFYRGMDIGTAKPTQEELNRVRHHFIDSLNVDEKYNINLYENDALGILNKLFQNHDVVFMTGGSGMYIDAVCHGMDELPDSVPEMRERLNNIMFKQGLEVLQKMLLEKDPEYYAEADINNPHRVIRALEVNLLSGKKFSTLRKGLKKQRDFSVSKIGILSDRDELYARINHRVDEMIMRGLVDEVKSLLRHRNQQSMQTVGYKEIVSYLDKYITLEQAVLLIKQNTRNYAKRQMTWMRRDKEVVWRYAEEITYDSICNL
jgi:tRNA dimethylallyltransferase